MNDKKIRKIIFKLIVTLVILSPSAMNFYELLMKIRLPKLRNLIESNFKLYTKAPESPTYSFYDYNYTSIC